MPTAESLGSSSNCVTTWTTCGPLVKQRRTFEIRELDKGYIVKVAQEERAFETISSALKFLESQLKKEKHTY